MKVRNVVFGLLAAVVVGAFQNCEGMMFAESPTVPYLCNMGCGCGEIAPVPQLYYVGRGPLVEELGQMFDWKYETLPVCEGQVANAPNAMLQMIARFTKGSEVRACSMVLTKVSYEVQADGKIFYLKTYDYGDEAASRMEVLGADLESFSFRNAVPPFSDYAIDNRHVYFRGQLLEGVDRTTFKAKQNLVGHDANAAYFGSKRVEKAELCRHRSSDLFVGTASRVFYNGDVTAIDPLTLKFLGAVYWKDRQAVYCSTGLKLVTLDASPTTFVYDNRTREARDGAQRFNGCASL